MKTGYYSIIGNSAVLQSAQAESGAHPVAYIRIGGLFYRGQSGQGVKLTTHYHLVTRVRISGDVRIQDVRRDN